MASRELARIGSATAMSPASRPSIAAYIGVLASLASAAARSPSGATSTVCSDMSSSLPTATVRPSTIPTAPRPLTDLNPVGVASVRPRSFAYRTMPSASGCSLIVSTAATSASSSSSVIVTPGARTMSVTVGRPSVTVPVLSSATVVMVPSS